MYKEKLKDSSPGIKVDQESFFKVGLISSKAFNSL